MLNTVVSWIEENPAVRDSAVNAVRRGDKALPDELLSEPAKLVDIVRGLVIEAVNLDAPEGVVEELLTPLRQMTAGARELDKLRFVTDTLSEMQGLRDRSELEPVLENALADAPDEANRTKIESMLEVLRRPPPIEGLRVSSVEAGDRLSTDKVNPCPVCCIIGCIPCGVNCAPCCIVACSICPVDIPIPI